MNDDFLPICVPENAAEIRAMYKRQRERVTELEAENKALLTLLQDMTDAGMVPTTSASDGGASMYSRAVRIADRVREALTKEE